MRVDYSSSARSLDIILHSHLHCDTCPRSPVPIQEWLLRRVNRTSCVDPCTGTMILIPFKKKKKTRNWDIKIVFLFIQQVLPNTYWYLPSYRWAQPNNNYDYLHKQNKSFTNATSAKQYLLNRVELLHATLKIIGEYIDKNIKNCSWRKI